MNQKDRECGRSVSILFMKAKGKGDFKRKRMINSPNATVSSNKIQI